MLAHTFIKPDGTVKRQQSRHLRELLNRAGIDVSRVDQQNGNGSFALWFYNGSARDALDIALQIRERTRGIEIDKTCTGRATWQPGRPISDALIEATLAEEPRVCGWWRTPRERWFAGYRGEFKLFKPEPKPVSFFDAFQEAA